ncbi:MAG: STAS domain-containing protein [Solirubrobacterales bacterium]
MSADAGSGAGRRVPLQVSQDCVVASIQTDLSAELLSSLRIDLLELVRTSRSTAVILDLSGLQIIDREDFEGLRHTMSMAEIMGARPVLCGLRPGVVAALVELGADVDGIEAAGDLDGAFKLIADTDTDHEVQPDGEQPGSEPDGAPGHD